MLAAAITRGSATVTNVVPEHLDCVLQGLTAVGASVNASCDRVTLSADGSFRPLDVWATPYPGMPSDVQAQWMALLALVLGAMSVGILLVTLVEAGESQSRYGQVILLVASIGEFLTLIALTAYNLIYRHGFGVELFEEIGKALFLFVVAYSILAVLRLIVWWFPHHFRRWVNVDDPSEIGVRAGFVMMLSLACWACY